MTSNHKQFALLDGIRGVAAIFVLTRHTTDFWGNGHLFRSYIAVDIFFILSGFVIGYAYERKIVARKLGFRNFFLIRLIRLYPMFLASLAIGAFWNFYRIARGYPTWSYESLLETVVPSMVFLPSHAPHSKSLFPINGAYWSLFFELIVNGLYGAYLWRLTTRQMLPLLMAMALALGILSWHHGNLNTGFLWGYWSIVSGFTRAAFGILLGIILYRNHEKLTRLFGENLGPMSSPYLSAALLFIIMASPSLGRLDWLADFACVVMAFPVLITLSAQDVNKKLHSLLLLLGTASYPIYVLHPILAGIFEAVIIHFFGSQGFTRYAFLWGLLFVALLIAFCLLVERLFDAPLRSKLRARLLPLQPALLKQ